MQSTDVVEHINLVMAIPMVACALLLAVVFGVIFFKKFVRSRQVLVSTDGGAAGGLRSALGWLVTAICGVGVLVIVAGVLVESARTMDGAQPGLVSIDRGGWVGNASSWLTGRESAANSSGENVTQGAAGSETIHISETAFGPEDGRRKVDDGSSTKPEWVETSRVEGQDRTLTVVSSDPRLERDAALSEAWGMVREQVQRDFAQFDDRARAWSIPFETLEEVQLVRRRHAEQYQTDLGAVGQAEMHIMHLQIERSPRVRDELNVAWQNELVRRRVAGMGIIAAFLTVCFGSAAVCLRSNVSVSGGIANRVKLACTGAVGLAGAVAVCGLSLV